MHTCEIHARHNARGHLTARPRVIVHREQWEGSTAVRKLAGSCFEQCASRDVRRVRSEDRERDPGERIRGDGDAPANINIIARGEPLAARGFSLSMPSAAVLGSADPRSLRGSSGIEPPAVPTGKNYRALYHRTDEPVTHFAHTAHFAAAESARKKIGGPRSAAVPHKASHMRVQYFKKRNRWRFHYSIDLGSEARAAFCNIRIRSGSPIGNPKINRHPVFRNEFGKRK